jgi:16S rRNA C1402 (ribose-2'-O) methylase RsmI
VVFLEAPHRIAETISDAESILARRQIMIFRELTKINESLVIRPIMTSKSPGELVEKGEFTVIVCPDNASDEPEHIDQLSASRLFNLLEESGLVQQTNVMAAVAAALDVSMPAATKAVKKGKILAKRQSEAKP